MLHPKIPYFMMFFCACVLHAYEIIPLQKDWYFHLDTQAPNPPSASRIREWKQVKLPHDWSILQAPAPDEPSGGGGGFFPTGKAWYARILEAPEAWRNQHVFVHFESIYRDAEVWINGTKVASRANGYLPIRADLTPHLNIGESNVLAVRVDNSRQPNSRWYSGSGIYRPAHLEVRHPVRIRHDSTRIETSALHPDLATIGIHSRIINATSDMHPVTVDMFIISPEGLPVASHSLTREIDASGEETYSLQLPVPHPQLWSPDTPTLYRVVVRTFLDGLLTDRLEESFGIRTIEISASTGITLNGRPILLVGGNVHHDHGPLGAAAYQDAETRKVRLLKEAGFNAVRTAHNPPSTAFLDACDQEGMLVIDEAFDGWKISKVAEDYGRDFSDNWERDLKDFVQRDRNHPSVIMWSIGNEMYERRKDSAVELAEKMVALVKRHDQTRPVTAGICGVGERGAWKDLDGLFSKLDVAGYNYELDAQHEKDHERIANRVIYSSESYQTDTFSNWKCATQNPYVVGDFVWSGIDYLGEAGIGRVYGADEEPMMHWEGNHYPWHGSACGDLDVCGFRKPISHYRNIIWDRGETLYLSVREPGEWNPTKWATPPEQSSWTWPGHEGENVEVTVYTRHETVRVFLDYTLIGEVSVSEDTEFKASFTVPYKPGSLIAQGLKNGAVVEETTLTTAGPPAVIQLTTDRTKIRPNGEDLAFVEVTIADNGLRHCPNAGLPVTFSIEGPGEILTTGNGNPASTKPYGANPLNTYQGKALVVIRSLEEAGDILLRAQSGDLTGVVAIQSTWRN